jgi:glycosyltransferase involved in cell wall biosynthesis
MPAPPSFAAASFPIAIAPVRISYVCYRDAFVPDGVVKKINSQTAFWRTAGHEVQVFCVAPRPAGGRTQSLDGVVSPIPNHRKRLSVTRALFKDVRAYDPELVYLRYDFYLPPPVGLLRSVPTALEVNTDDASEWAIRSLRAALYTRPNRRLIFAHTNGFVCVTHELASTSAIAGSGKPAIVIGNGLEPSAVRPLPRPANERPHLAFVGHPHLRWHGIDKLLWLAEQLPEVDVEIVGYEAADAPRAPSNVTFHGFLHQEAYEPILARADVAVGTLALHRKSMTEASPLKVREYLLFGIPTITAYEDTDFLGERPWFILQLPNVEENVRTHLDEIRAFVARVRGRRVPRDEVLGRLSSERKELDRLAFLERLEGSSRHGGRRTSGRTA